MMPLQFVVLYECKYERVNPLEIKVLSGNKVTFDLPTDQKPQLRVPNKSYDNERGYVYDILTLDPEEAATFFSVIDLSSVDEIYFHHKHSEFYDRVLLRVKKCHVSPEGYDYFDRYDISFYDRFVLKPSGNRVDKGNIGLELRYHLIATIRPDKSLSLIRNTGLCSEVPFADESTEEFFARVEHLKTF
jgi:hypothetical protein